MMEAKRFFTEEALGACREQIEQETDPDKLLEMADVLRDLLLGMMPAVIHGQKGVRKKQILRRRLQELAADQYGLL
jgi:hypothetical protein